MRRGRRLAGALVVFLALMLPAPGAAQQALDSALSRIERMIVSGDRAAARGVTDSLLNVLAPESPRLADVLYWRAASASNAADAERDYLRIGVEYPLSARAPDALLALAQLEFARGDRSAARRRFDRLLRDYPTGRHVTRASLWSGRLAIEERDTGTGCATLAAARPQVSTADVELANQFDYFLGQCARLPAVPDTTSAPSAPAGGRGMTPAPRFSVQVAAYSARREADALATRLKARGFDVRVAVLSGGPVPYRVRIGRYATRPDATAALRRIRNAGLNGIVVEAEPQ